MKSLLVALACAALASAQDRRVAPGELPHSFEVAAPSAGYVLLEFPDQPKGFTPFLSFAEKRDWPMHSDSCEARVEAGTVAFILSDRWGTKIAGEIRFRVTFTAEDDSSEPNGDWARPRRAGFDEKLALRLRPAGDRDVVVLEAPGPGYVRATFEGAHADVEAVFNLDGTRNLGANLARVDVAGAVFAVVQDHWGSARREPLHVTFSFEPETDAFEPNDTPGSAAALEPGDWQRARIAPGNDSDWFAVDVPEDGYIVLDCEISDRFDPHLQASRPGEDRPFADGRNLPVKSGPVLLRLYERWGRPTPGPFAFRVLFVAEPDETGPNDSADDPARIETNRPYELAIATPTDLDFLQFGLAQPAAVEIETLGPLPRDLTVALLDAEGRETPFGAGPRFLGPGTHRVVLHTRWGSYSLQPFTFRVLTSPIEDPEEANDSRESARPLALGATIDVRLGPGEHDEDWYALDVPREGLLYVMTSEDSLWPDHTAAVHLLDAEGKEVKELVQSPFKPDRLCAVKAGRWFLRVRPQQWHVPPIQTLRLEAVLAVTDTGEKPPPGVLDIAVIGLDLDTNAMPALRAIASEGKASFENTNDLGGLENRMRTVVEEGKSDAARRARRDEGQKPDEGRRWVWLAGGGATAFLAAILVVVMVLRRRPGAV
ncbi:MAG: hypothetical protein IT452_10585 [Planctomycetia bacterium]|nr:hypothetical protein [Planctomycetia bacterium]